MATTVTFGSGGDYATLNQAWAALCAATSLPSTPLVDDVDLVPTGDSSLSGNITANPPSNSNSINAGNYTVRIIGPPGNINTVYKLDTAGYIFQPVVVTGTLKIENLFIRNNSTTLRNVLSLRNDRYNAGVPYTNVYVLVKNCYIKGNCPAKNSDGIVIGACRNISVVNVKIFDCNNGINLTDNTGSIAGYSDFQNLSVINCQRGCYVDAATNLVRLANCVFVNNSGDYLSGGAWGPASIAYCADSDNSLPAHTGKVTGIVDGDFLSVDDTDENFLNIDTDSSLYGVGTTSILADNDSGIEGNPRPNGAGLVSIGASEPLIITRRPKIMQFF